jgi:hypothetical protein
MRKALLITGMFLMALFGSVQGYGQGYLKIRQPSELDTLLMKYDVLRSQAERNTDNAGIPGYRIQIFFDSGLNSGNKASKAKKEFEDLFPDIPGYITWKAPNYRVRVGDFRSRLEADKALSVIAKEYPNAWVIKDEINYPPLFKYTEE